MAEDPMLSQSEIDALLRALQEGGGTEEAPAEAPAAAAAASAPLMTVAAASPPPTPNKPELAKVYDLPSSFGLLLGVHVTLSVDLGSTVMELGDLLQLGRSSLIVLDGHVDEPLVLSVNGVPFAQGTVVETNGRYGMRLTEFVTQEGAKAS